jgi:hypothetical protein
MSMRRNLLTTAAAAALVGATTSGALAFDQVDWNWTNTVAQTTNITVTVAVAPANPDVGQVEAGQAFIGNGASTATSNANNVAASPNVTIDNAALTALNNQSLSADDVLLVHSGQFALGAFDDGIATPNWQGFQDALAARAIGAALPGPLFAGENSYTILALATLAAAGNGYVVPATITSNATMTSDTGRFLSNSATAMANSASWNVTGGGATGSVLEGDLTQLGFAGVTATAGIASNVLNGTSPTLSNAATAVGNNLNVRVNVPTP